MVYRLTGDKYSDTMIYNIAFVYNGAIWLDNERGRVILDTISNAKNPTMEAGDGMLHILLCDDDAIFTEALKRLIEAQPEFNRRYMQIECVHDPNALKKAAVQKADMIFLDIDMGDVNGIALARQIRTIRKDAVLIFVTNYGEYAAERDYCRKQQRKRCPDGLFCGAPPLPVSVLSSRQPARTYPAPARSALSSRHLQSRYP